MNLKLNNKVDTLNNHDSRAFVTAMTLLHVRKDKGDKSSKVEHCKFTSSCERILEITLPCNYKEF